MFCLGASWPRVLVLRLLYHLCFRYTSHFEAPPDISTTSHSSGSKLSRAVRRMMTNAEVEKSKEELAWQMAGMIVKDVTTRSSAPIANCSSATNGVSISAATADSWPEFFEVYKSIWHSVLFAFRLKLCGPIFYPASPFYNLLSFVSLC